MGSSTFTLFLSSLLLSLAMVAVSQPPDVDVYLERICNDTTGNYTANSAYEANLNTNSIISRFSNLSEFNHGFSNLSAGESTTDKVYSIALCRGDMNQSDCNTCLNYTATELKRFCPFYKAATAWCAAGPLRKYAAGRASVGNQDNVYATMQCTPESDMDQRNCDTCLTSAQTELRNCCYGRYGCRILRPTCVLRFESNNPFYNQTADTLPFTPSSPIGGKGRGTTPTVIIVIASVVAVLVLVFISMCIFMRRRRNKPVPVKVETAPADGEMSGIDSLQFDFDSVLVATDNFFDANKLGQGGFGAVYKGQLPNGREIAVKRLSRESGQGDREFKTEVALVAKLQHRNLVRLLGFCLQGQERLLIYEFVPNASLDHFIFDRIKRAQLDWETRFKIIGGITRGLLYLHEDSRLRFIHRDLKASNILLDAEMVPKIADFGMFGYMAPEYVINGQFSVKSDVFSFGVLLLEIISGQKNNCFRHGEDEEYILSYAWKSWKEGTALNLVDPTLADGSRTEIMRCIHIALLCVQENIAARPTMASIALMLNSFSTTLEVPSQPAFFMQSNVESDKSLSFVSTSNKSELLPLSHNEVSISELSPR
ncbi:cysteine-rich RLK (RECEPTOR-like protein kinase) 29 [Hibiscus trionum]|uniref:Cysteine-rich RLK (RECEPTOR-like protein kinase) 29 n=1 Tax=Hibiscus trionum TaxID=183268 RepID=A0A9W7LPZ1_HIBTR|nr:cysteine-rich RLK (RECEPTOR-like protein kinase) 29 [Hibiscus trionum]